MRHAACLTLAAGLAISSNAVADPGDWIFIKIADTTTSDFTNFFAPALNNDRKMVVQATSTITGEGMHHWNGKNTFSLLRVMANNSTIGEWGIDDSGRGAFASQGQGVFHGGPGQVETKFDSLGPLNIGTAQMRKQVNSDGNMAVSGTQAGGSNTMVSFVEDGALTNSEVRIADNTSPGSPFSWVGLARINDENRVYFVALTPTNVQQLHAGDPAAGVNNSLLMVNAATTSLKDIADFDVNADDEMLIRGRNDLLRDTLFYIDADGNLSEWIVFGSPFTELANPVAPNINNVGDRAFQAGSTRWTGSGEWGIFTGPDHDDDRVIGHDDPLFGGTVATAVMIVGGLSEESDIGFYYRLTSGEQGIAIAVGRPDCEADLTGSSDPNSADYGDPDGDADGDDFFFFLDAFAAEDLRHCDFTGSSDPNEPTYAYPDLDCDGDDFFFYLDAFAQGCP
ncbi:MAG: GC-type dockerin domain-anchored protein [Phycisphaerales bacterium JB037]